ncbi:MAG: hypothetical protein Q8Q20_01265 [bacterium]|nr:hypothetical protein [bacterium]
MSSRETGGAPREVQGDSEKFLQDEIDGAIAAISSGLSEGEREELQTMVDEFNASLEKSADEDQRSREREMFLDRLKDFRQEKAA